MLSGIFFYPVRSTWLDVRTYLFVIIFAAGNLLLPQLCHLVPSGGQILLPIYFFTLVASYKFGWKVGLATALLSPILNYVCFGMPTAAILPAILIKSTLLSLIAAYVSLTYRRLSLFHLLFVVLSYQIIGSAIEWVVTQRFAAAIADFTIGLPGMAIQVFGGWWLLKNWHPMAAVKSWDEMQSRIKAIDFNEPFDMIVAIANGGIIPAAMINQRLQLPMELLKINYRDSHQKPIYSSPQLLNEINFKVKGKKVLLVEDRVKTGATVNYAKELLKDAALVKTFAVNGSADYALYNEACFSFPWIL